MSDVPVKVGRFSVEALRVRCVECGTIILAERDLQDDEDSEEEMTGVSAAEACACNDDDFIAVSFQTFAVKLVPVEVTSARDRFKVLDGGKSLTSGKPDRQDS